MSDQKPRKRRSRIKTVLTILVLIVIALATAWIFGPRTPADLTVRFDPTTMGDDLDAYLARQEARFDDIPPSATKEIVWAYPSSKAKTPVSLVYLHGFSAAKAEIRPVPDMVAKKLGANLYYGRLAGHGRSGDAMAEATVNAWIQDAAEAVAIGERIGEKVVVIATSTGGTLAALAASEPELRDRIDGLVLISPNFKVRASGASLLTWPFAETIVRLVVGKERGFEPHNAEHGENWTTQYPSNAVLPMAAMVKAAGALPFEQMQIPVLFIFSPDDQVVDQSVTAEIAERWGGSADVLAVTSAEDPSNHVIAGDILSPSNNDQIAAAIESFIQGL
jgi:alpha-beta hydrolase superfamily lysophospholipase